MMNHWFVYRHNSSDRDVMVMDIIVVVLNINWWR